VSAPTSSAASRQVSSASMADPRPVPARVLKRAFDLVGAALLTMLTAPLLALACIAIRIESRGSPIYRQRRVGKGNRQFDLYKLRTMVSGAEQMGAGLVVDEGDPRITRVGAALRRFSLDELPNLFNVLIGDMSLVGPRPTVRVQVAQYSERQLQRLAVEPGITGWAQVRGRAALPWHDRIELDLWYIQNWSIWLDVRILASTARLLLTGKGLYRGRTGGWRPEADPERRRTKRPREPSR
jgi:lipopolysaccharide/colanic/teichoic acid biosynthesis glycosyltransferase